MVTSHGRPAAPVGGRDRPRAAPPMDPRFRQRRVEVRRQEGRRRLRFLLGSASAACVVAGAVGATRSPLLDVDRVEVRGARRTPRPALVSAAGLGPGTLMVEVDGEGLTRRVQRLPWVLRARAERSWPATVVIHVTERAPAAAVRAAGGGWAVVDRTGRVLEVGPGRPPSLPALSGVPDAGPPGTTLGAGGALHLRVAAALPPPLRRRVAEVAVVRGEVVLRLGPPGGEVRLGPPESLDEKLTSASTVLEKVNPAGLRVLDVRAPATPALTRR